MENKQLKEKIKEDEELRRQEEELMELEEPY